MLVASLLPFAGMAATSTYSTASQASSSEKATELAKQAKLRQQFEKKRSALEPKLSKSQVNSGKIQNFPIQTGDAPDQSTTSSDSNH